MVLRKEQKSIKNECAPITPFGYSGVTEGLLRNKTMFFFAFGVIFNASIMNKDVVL